MNTSAKDSSQEATTSTQHSHTDDESITTSTESDSPETWTLVKDNKKRKSKPTVATTENTNNANKADIDNRIDDLSCSEASIADENKEIGESADSRTDDDSNIDDVSEGISIISETDSAGRASPLAISDNFNVTDLSAYSNVDGISPVSMLRLPIHIPQTSFSLPNSSMSSSTSPPPSLPPVAVAEEKTLRQRRMKRSASGSVEKSEQIALNVKNESIRERDAVVGLQAAYPLVRQGFKGLFFTCASLVILAFIGKLRNPDWQPFASGGISSLEQKLNDLELQNNLMRAEIDILSKQVNYLNSLSEKKKKNYNNMNQGDQQRRQQRNFKQTGEWIMKQGKETNNNFFAARPGGIADDLENVGEKLYKCSDGKFVANADMCVEQVVDIKVDEIQPTKVQTNAGDETKQSYGNGVPKTAANNRDSNEGETANKSNNNNNKKYLMKNDNRNSKEREYHHNIKNKYEKPKHWKQKHKRQNNVDESDEDHYDDHDDEHDNDDDDDFSADDDDKDVYNDDSLEGFGKRKFNSKEKYMNKHANNMHANANKQQQMHAQQQSDEKFNKEDRSNERTKRYYSGGSSKEQQRRNVADSSARKSGEWHEKLMQQRENARRHHHHDFRERNKNWYIERGDGREKMRHS